MYKHMYKYIVLIEKEHVHQIFFFLESAWFVLKNLFIP